MSERPARSACRRATSAPWRPLWERHWEYNPRKATWKLEMRTGLGAWVPELLAGTTRGPGRGVTEQGEAHGSAACGQWNSKGLDT